MKITKKIILMGCIVAGLASVSHAQDNDISSTINVYRISTNAEGQESAKEVAEIAPGDTLEYRVIYTNNLSDAISNLRPVLPIPSGMQYIKNTARPEIAYASLGAKGDSFQTLPIKQKKKLESGLVVERDVPQREYRRLQWTVATLNAQESITLKARVWVIKGNS